MSELNKLQQDMIGQELPEQEIVDGQPVEAKPVDTPTPEPTPEPETSPEPEVDPITKAFKEEGLDKQFKDPEHAIRNWRQENQYRTRLEQENARLRAMYQQPQQQAAPKEKPVVTGDDLYADPNTALDRVGVARKEDVETVSERIARIEAERRIDQAVGFFAEHDELKDVAQAWRKGEYQYEGNDTFRRMTEIYTQSPALQQMAPREVLPLLYNAVRGERGVAPVSTTPPVDPKKKEAATTTSGKPARPAGVKDASYYSKLSPAEIEKELGFTET